MSRSKVAEWKDKYYGVATGSLPDEMNFTFKFSVEPGSQTPLDPATIGTLKMISLPEARDALVFAIDDAI